MTIADLIEQKTALEAQIFALQAEQRAAAVLQVKELMDNLGVSLSDLGSKAKAKVLDADAVFKRFGKKVPVKFRDPETGATWTGRGIKPRWLADKVSAGHAVTEFAIN